LIGFAGVRIGLFMETATCELKDCKGYYPPPCYVSKVDTEISKKKYGIVICHWDQKLIETGKRNLSI